MEASGGTNIYQGLKTGLQRIREASNSSTVVQPMMIFLTDGHATSGVAEKKGHINGRTSRQCRFECASFLSFLRKVCRLKFAENFVPSKLCLHQKDLQCV